MSNAEATRVAGKWRIVSDRRERAARRPSWQVEGPGWATDLFWSRSAAVAAGRKLDAELDAALTAAGL